MRPKLYAPDAGFPELRMRRPVGVRPVDANPPYVMEAISFWQQAAGWTPFVFAPGDGKITLHQDPTYSICGGPQACRAPVLASTHAFGLNGPYEQAEIYLSPEANVGALIWELAGMFGIDLENSRIRLPIRLRDASRMLRKLRYS